MPVLTTETRLTEKEAHDIMGYIQKYRVDYGIIQRYVWLVIVRQKGVINKSELNTEIQRKFSVTKRTANSVIYDMKGRYKALQELKKTEKVSEEDFLNAVASLLPRKGMEWSGSATELACGLESIDVAPSVLTRQLNEAEDKPRSDYGKFTENRFLSGV